MLNRGLARGLSQWREFVSEAGLQGKALRHMMNRELSKGWRGWSAFYEDLIRKREGPCAAG